MEIPFNLILGQKTARNHDTTCRKSSHNKEMGNDWAEYFLNVVVSMNLIENSSFTVLYHVMEENVDERYLKREISFITVEHKKHRDTRNVPTDLVTGYIRLFGFSKKTSLLTDQNLISILFIKGN